MFRKLLVIVLTMVMLMPALVPLTVTAQDPTDPISRIDEFLRNGRMKMTSADRY